MLPKYCNTAQRAINSKVEASVQLKLQVKKDGKPLWLTAFSGQIKDLLKGKENFDIATRVCNYRGFLSRTGRH